ncbi:MAG: hypothetical protein CL868_07305 [Cytophagaceae bacterium]|nr:hypothetical protein [Cytophagaceae bacterium]
MFSYGQEIDAFNQVEEFYLKGNSAVTGNNILSKHETRDYNNPTGVNDQYKMRYVDIDDDNTTFSSSSADLIIPENAMIKYAALYWAATYPGAEGKKKAHGNRYVYELKQGRKKPINDILIKLPDQQTYSTIHGEVIYDGFKEDKDLEENNQPYVCFSNITDIIKLNGKASGTYTVANIPALEGYMYGGSSAGWMLYVVYENETDPLQYITTYHGFKFIDKEHTVVLNFENFRSIEEGEVKTELTIGAIEGDNALKRDQVALYNDVRKKFITLTTKERAADNFFNSKITVKNDEALNRKPNSMNTLGFDIAQIDNKNAILSNNAQDAKLQFTTKADRYSIYFTAFQTTISKKFYEEITAAKINMENAAPATSTTVGASEGQSVLMDAVRASRQKMQDVKKETIERRQNEEPVAKTEHPVEEDDTQIDDPAFYEVVEGPSVSVPDLEGAYYIITNVFSRKSNALRWSRFVEEQGLAPKTFVRPSNNYYYVYIDKGNDPVSLYKKIQELRKRDQMEKTWMLKINLD